MVHHDARCQFERRGASVEPEPDAARVVTKERVHRPCNREHFELRAPGSGRGRDLNPAGDGMISVEGPPDLVWTFGHATPAAGLSIGDHVTAGDVVATMFYNHGFDFGVIN